jgi:hypothetical protein
MILKKLVFLFFVLAVLKISAGPDDLEKMGPESLRRIKEADKIRRDLESDVPCVLDNGEALDQIKKQHRKGPAIPEEMRQQSLCDSGNLSDVKEIKNRSLENHSGPAPCDTSQSNGGNQTAADQNVNSHSSEHPYTTLMGGGVMVICGTGIYLKWGRPCLKKSVGKMEKGLKRTLVSLLALEFSQPN